MNPRCDSASQLANTSTNHQRKHIGIKQRDLNTMGQTQWNMRNHESMSHAQNEVPKWGYVRTYARTYVGTYVCTYVRTYVRTFSCPGHIVSINKLSFAFRKISGTYVFRWLPSCRQPLPRWQLSRWRLCSLCFAGVLRRHTPSQKKTSLSACRLVLLVRIMNMRSQHPILILKANSLAGHHATCTVERLRGLTCSTRANSTPSSSNAFSQARHNFFSQDAHMHGILPCFSAFVIVTSLARLVLGVLWHPSKWYATPEG